ncbi:AraC family transcriptional regulator [Solimonas terrae]|uniref:AraC family transcriptional regulator n=1 Tax=Solimonas terrae TaxID=1396819 RepID=A0A6M2BMP4_9GAMM|nr:AraC family transcriptional regulator [Solimonas terrae]
MALLARSIAQLHDDQLWPLRVEFALPAPRDTRSWQRTFGVRPVFGSAATRLVYPLAQLNLPVHISAEARERLGTQWRGDERQAPIALERQVERAIVALLPTGDCSLARVASLVDLQPRTLQAQLQQQRLNFSLLLQQAREKLAREHLARSDIDLTTLAMNPGFGELAFSAARSRAGRECRRAAGADAKTPGVPRSKRVTARSRSGRGDPDAPLAQEASGLRRHLRLATTARVVIQTDPGAGPVSSAVRRRTDRTRRGGPRHAPASPSRRGLHRSRGSRCACPGPSDPRASTIDRHSGPRP